MWSSWWSSCAIVPPSARGWCYAVAVHGACCALGAVPAALSLRRRSSRTRTRAVVVAVAAAASAAWWGRRGVERWAPDDRIAWVGPFLVSTCGFSTFFRALQAGFGTFPAGADADARTWVLWFAALPEPDLAEGRPRPPSRTRLIALARAFAAKIVGLAVLLSSLTRWPAHGHRAPLDGVPELLATHVNGFLHVWLLYLFASFCEDFSTIANTILTGGRVRFHDGFANPLLASRSYKEVWGSRWNLPVHSLLKRTVYVPLRARAGLGRGVSATLTFVASGLLHEYNFFVHNHRSHVPGEATLFFVSTGVLMSVESYAWTALPSRAQRLLDALPSFVLSFLLTFLVAGAFERLFVRSWLEAGLVDAVAEMMPYVVCD